MGQFTDKILAIQNRLTVLRSNEDGCGPNEWEERRRLERELKELQRCEADEIFSGEPPSSQPPSNGTADVQMDDARIPYCGLVRITHPGPPENSSHCLCFLQLLFNIPRLRREIEESNGNSDVIDALLTLFVVMSHGSFVADPEDFLLRLDEDKLFFCHRDILESIHDMIEILPTSLSQQFGRSSNGTLFLDDNDIMNAVATEMSDSSVFLHAIGGAVDLAEREHHGHLRLAAIIMGYPRAAAEGPNSEDYVIFFKSNIPGFDWVMCKDEYVDGYDSNTVFDWARGGNNCSVNLLVYAENLTFREFIETPRRIGDNHSPAPRNSNGVQVPNASQSGVPKGKEEAPEEARENSKTLSLSLANAVLANLNVFTEPPVFSIEKTFPTPRAALIAFLLVTLQNDIENHRDSIAAFFVSEAVADAKIYLLKLMVRLPLDVREPAWPAADLSSAWKLTVTDVAEKKVVHDITRLKASERPAPGASGVLLSNEDGSLSQVVVRRTSSAEALWSELGTLIVNKNLAPLEGFHPGKLSGGVGSKDAVKSMLGYEYQSMVGLYLGIDYFCRIRELLKNGGHNREKIDFFLKEEVDEDVKIEVNPVTQYVQVKYRAGTLSTESVLELVLYWMFLVHTYKLDMDLVHFVLWNTGSLVGGFEEIFAKGCSSVVRDWFRYLLLETYVKIRGGDSPTEALPLPASEAAPALGSAGDENSAVPATSLQSTPAAKSAAKTKSNSGSGSKRPKTHASSSPGSPAASASNAAEEKADEVPDTGLTEEARKKCWNHELPLAAKRELLKSHGALTWAHGEAIGFRFKARKRFDAKVRELSHFASHNPKIRHPNATKAYPAFPGSVHDAFIPLLSYKDFEKFMLCIFLKSETGSWRSLLDNSVNRLVTGNIVGNDSLARILYAELALITKDKHNEAKAGKSKGVMSMADFEGAVDLTQRNMTRAIVNPDEFESYEELEGAVGEHEHVFDQTYQGLWRETIEMAVAVLDNEEMTPAQKDTVLSGLASKLLMAVQFVRSRTGATHIDGAGRVKRAAGLLRSVNHAHIEEIVERLESIQEELTTVTGNQEDDRSVEQKKKKNKKGSKKATAQTSLLDKYVVKTKTAPTASSTPLAAKASPTPHATKSSPATPSVTTTTTGSTAQEPQLILSDSDEGRV